MDCNYDKWNRIKKKIAESNHKPPYFKEGDVWWVSVGYNIGNEVYGKGKDFLRPVLILKKFNPYFFIGIPLSSRLKKSKYYPPITVQNKKNSALISQIKAFSSLRLKFKFTELSIKDFRKIKELLTEMLK